MMMIMVAWVVLSPLYKRDDYTHYAHYAISMIKGLIRGLEGVIWGG